MYKLDGGTVLKDGENIGHLTDMPYQLAEAFAYLVTLEPNERLVGALEWYADPLGYTTEGIKKDGGVFGWNHADRGAYARTVLGELDKSVS